MSIILFYTAFFMSFISFCFLGICYIKFSKRSREKYKYGAPIIFLFDRNRLNKVEKRLLDLFLGTFGLSGLIFFYLSKNH